MAFPAYTQGHVIGIPFAAAIVADDDVIERIGNTASSRAVSAFLRYVDQMDALTNVLNRRGILALKGIERRHKAAITADNWQAVIDEARARRTAQSIY